MVAEEDPVQMVELVLNDAGQDAVVLEIHLTTGHLQVPQLDTARTPHLAVDAGKRKAAFFEPGSSCAASINTGLSIT